MKASQLLEQETRLDDKIHDILRGIAGIRDIIEVLNQASSSMLATTLDRSREPVNNILALFEDASVYIFNRLAADDPVYASCNETRPSDFYDVEEYLSRLEKLRKAFHASWCPSATSCVNPTDTIDHEKPIFAWKYVQEATEESAAKITDPYDVLNLVRSMHPTGYDPERACLDGTREAILNRIITWTQNRDSSESFMWISGQAGMGKTSVATSICRYLDSIQALAGSFFCRHNDPNFNDPLGLINGIVYEIASRFPPYAHEVASAIRTNRTLCNAHFRIRYEGLIQGPLKRLKLLSVPTTLIVIVDALDECGDHDSRKRTAQMLHDMSQLAPWLKVILTARPEVDILEYFRHHCADQPIVQLQTYDASSDIRAYIQDQIGDLAKKEQWPDSSIGRLCSLAQGVFLWAAIATKYIKRSSVLALSRLQRVLENQKSPVTEHFDALYTRALQAALKDDNDETKEVYHRCIGAILATSKRKPLTIPNLQLLLSVISQIAESPLEKTLETLGPLVLVTDGQYVNFHHSSFKDYITDPLRSRGLCIQLEKYEADLTNCCLTFMQQHLRFNICKLESSHLLNIEVPDLDLRIHSRIGPVLKYACIHWVDHFVASPTQALVEVIRKFMEGPQFMYWIEVLSLLGCMDVGVTTLSRLVSSMLTQSPSWDLILSWAKDAHRFLLSFFHVIAASTPHLYVSAIAFAPAKSLTVQRMQPHFPNTVSVAKGGNVNWHPCIGTTFYSHAVQSLSISPDGLRVATGHPDGSIHIRDMRSGAPIYGALIGHFTSVTCVAFSPCGHFVASSSYDNKIRIWNISGSHETYVLAGHNSSVHCIAFSAATSLVASGSSDKNIRLWDTKTMRPVGQPYVGHANRVSSMAFSPDGTKLASGSWDKTIRIWSVDLDCLQLIDSPLVLTGHSDSVNCVAFSPDGSRLTSGSADKTLRMWGVQDGGSIESLSSTARHSDSITSITYSPNGGIIASSSLDGVVQLWDAGAFTPVSRPFGHSNAVNSISFSPDGMYVVSGSTDMTTRVWEISACPKSLHTTPFVGHSSTVYSVAISRDGTRFISASADHTMRTWDAQTGTQIGDPYVGHSSNVDWVSFSPDETRIVSASYDKTMKLWDTTTHAIINSYQHKSTVYGPVFSPDGTLIAFGTDDHGVFLWDWAEWKMVGEALRGHSGSVVPLAFSPDGACVASGSYDHTIRLWDIKTRSRSGTPLSGHKNNVRSVAFAPCGTRVISGSDDKTIRIWDKKTGDTILELTGHTEAVATIAISPDGSCIASGASDRSVRLWDSNTGQRIGQPFTGHSDHVRFIAFSPDGNYLVSSSNDKTIRTWSLDTSHTVPDQVDDLPNTFRWPTNPYELSSHPRHPGWVTHNQHSLVFWLPPQYQKPDQLLSTHYRGSSPTSLDYSKFVHGTAWTEVACDSIRHGSG